MNRTWLRRNWKQAAVNAKIHDKQVHWDRVEKTELRNQLEEFRSEFDAMMEVMRSQISAQREFHRSMVLVHAKLDEHDAQFTALRGKCSTPGSPDQWTLDGDAVQSDTAVSQLSTQDELGHRVEELATLAAHFDNSEAKLDTLTMFQCPRRGEAPQWACEALAEVARKQEAFAVQMCAVVSQLLQGKLEEFRAEQDARMSQFPTQPDLQMMLEEFRAEQGAMTSQLLTQQDLQMNLEEFRAEQDAMMSQFPTQLDLQMKLEELKAEQGAMMSQFTTQPDFLQLMGEAHARLGDHDAQLVALRGRCGTMESVYQRTMTKIRDAAQVDTPVSQLPTQEELGQQRRGACEAGGKTRHVEFLASARGTGQAWHAD